MKLPVFHAHLRKFAPQILVSICASIAVIAYLQALNYPFSIDDGLYITGNIRLAELRLTELWRLFVEPYNPTFEFLPLRDLSYWIDITLFGQNPAAFRLHNIVLYLLCLPLVYATSARLWQYFRPEDATSAPWAAAAVTALFALHPALVESVVWISGRKYILPDFFSLLALWLTVNTRREHGFSSRYAVATLLAFVAVMLSKASYVGVAPIIALLWLIFWRDLPLLQRRRALLLWPFAILLLAALLLLAFIVNNRGFDTVPAYFGLEAVSRSCAILGELARIALSPEARHYFYPLFEDPLFPVLVTVGVVVLGAVIWGSIALVRKRSLAGLALLIFLLLCMPYLQLIPAKPPSLAADRYVAFAIWPLALLLVSLSWRFKPLPRTAILLLFALPWLFQTVQRPRDWRSIETLIETDLRAYPGYYLPALFEIKVVQMPDSLIREATATANRVNSPVAGDVLNKLIKAYAATAASASSGWPQDAMTRLWNLSLDLIPIPAQAKWDTPMLFFWDESRNMLADLWEYLARQFNDDALVHYKAGMYLLNTHKDQFALAHLRAAINTQRLPEPMRATAFLNLGSALINTGEFSEAESALQSALSQSQPDTRAYCLLSEVYRHSERLELERTAAENCRKRSPDEQTAINSYQDGSYTSALNEFKPLADKGNAAAQLFLGLMYNKGEGVAQDDETAAAWYRKSAEQGNTDAQFNLGMMYRNGHGVPRDLKQAYQWFSLSASSGNVGAINAKQEADSEMMTEQVKPVN